MYNAIGRTIAVTTRAKVPGGHNFSLARTTRLVNADRIGRLSIAVTATVCALLSTPVLPACASPSASAGSCPDAEVVFARGTGEPAGIGEVGQAFVDSLRTKIGSKSVGVYAVSYPATLDFPTALDGISDAGTHVEHMAASCPNTRMVLAGYSQGAAVIGFVTSAAIPDGAPSNAPKPMPGEVANHVAAVTLFGMPSTRFMNSIGAPPIVIGPLYATKTKEFCAAGDPVCSDGGGDWAAHGQYTGDGMVEQAAVFAASQF
jgi:cutinase